MRQRRKSDLMNHGVDNTLRKDNRKESSYSILYEYPTFVFYCMLLIVPLYAIAKSAINQNWFMMVVDILLLPVGFVHGIFMLFGFTN